MLKAEAGKIGFMTNSIFSLDHFYFIQQQFTLKHTILLSKCDYIFSYFLKTRKKPAAFAAIFF